jgi:hypothetical protein
MDKQPGRELLAQEITFAGGRSFVADDRSWVVVDSRAYTCRTLLVCGEMPVYLAFGDMSIQSTHFPGHVENLDNR